MLKIEKEYEEKYGSIPISQKDRLVILVNTLNKKKRKKKISIFEEIKKIENIEWETYEFTLYLLPKATPRPRINKNTQIFYVRGSDVTKKIFRKYFKLHPHDMIITPMYFEVNAYLPTPASMKIEDKILAELGYIRPISKPDFDNLAKTYSDMLTGVLIYDDALIIEGTSKKFYSLKPRIEVKIKYMKDFDSLFNWKKIDSKLNKERNENL